MNELVPARPMIYLDYNATTPCAAEVVEAMLPYFSEKYGNAASKTHAYGWVADEAVAKARKQVADLIGAEAQEIVFTSGATESCNLALKGVAERYAVKGKHIITVNTEHKAVLDTCSHLEAQGAEVTYLPVLESGLIDMGMLAAAIRPDTILIAVMYANNETGVLQPIKEIGALAKQHQVLFFTDATQAVGKVPVNVQDEGIDLLALSAHKLYGPKGIGALYVRRKGPRVSMAAQIDGGGHERGFRSGTLNVPGIVGIGAACQLSAGLMEQEAVRQAAMREQLEQWIRGQESASINGETAPRLPHVCNFALPAFNGAEWVSKLNNKIAFSVGSACTSASNQPSHVLKAMGLSDELIKASLRFSLGRDTRPEQLVWVSGRMEQLIAEKKIKI